MVMLEDDKLVMDTEDKLVKKIKKIYKKKRDTEGSAREERGVVLVKHIPHGFYEPQMKKYFQQFGEVTRLRLSRSKKTGRSKGYAYVEFASDDVAKIVADAMKDYLMFRHRLMCKYIPQSELHPATFKRWNQPFKKPIGYLHAIKRHNTTPTNSTAAKKSLKKLKSKNKERLAKLKNLGIDYTMPEQKLD